MEFSWHSIKNILLVNYITGTGRQQEPGTNSLFQNLLPGSKSSKEYPIFRITILNATNFGLYLRLFFFVSKQVWVWLFKGRHSISAKNKHCGGYRSVFVVETERLSNENSV